MHPAYSVIIFTTASGAGYGLLFWLGLLASLGLVPRSPAFGFVGLALALVLITAGLLSSTAHLGHPERAWRAFSQWRTSWLSREGVAAVATYVPAVILGLGWVVFQLPQSVLIASALLSAALSVVVVWCTGMIYASLPTIRAWHQPLVPPIYILLALATGALLLNLLLIAFGQTMAWASWVALATLCLGWLAKVTYWSRIDCEGSLSTIESATGLGYLGRVKPLEPPHTQPNYVMREMGYEVGRKHAARLRRATVLLLFLVPAALSALVPAAGWPLSAVLAFPAVLSAGAGVLIERWLFFAEAQHVSMLYYRGREPSLSSHRGGPARA
jgi:DMSO reductase anchor subunit